MAIKSEQLKLLRIVVRTEFSDEIHATFIQSLQEVRSYVSLFLDDSPPFCMSSEVCTITHFI